MIITVKLYAGLNKYIPNVGFGEPLNLELPEKVTIKALTEQLKLPQNIKLICIVNGQAKDSASFLLDGDEINIFPPVGGG